MTKYVIFCTNAEPLKNNTSLSVRFRQSMYNIIQAYLGHCVTPSNYGRTAGYIADRAYREVQLDLAAWHDDVAYTIV
jgi:hypothetical protein